MAGYRGHIGIGVVTGIVVAAAVAISPLGASLAPAQQIVRSVLVVWLATVFSLFPDIDIKSKGQLLFYRLLFVLDGALMASGLFREAALLGLLALVPILSRHRGWTHTVWAAFLVPLPILATPLYVDGACTIDRGLEWFPYYAAAIAGYLSHLMADGLLFRRRRPQA